MHPEYITDKPGDCPICGMKLVPVEESLVKKTEAQENTATAYAPGAAVPAMSSMPGMAGMEGVKTGNEAAAPPAEIKKDRVTVYINPEKQQLINVRTDTVEIRGLGNSVLASGVVAYDPELYYAQQQYISALKSGTTDELDAAATRLKIMGLSEAQVKELAQKGAPDKTLLISENSRKIWVYAQVYQDDLKFVKRGSPAEISSAATGNRVFEGTVVAIDPSLNPESRSVRVRITVDNAGQGLKPEMYVDVKIKSTRGTFLSVPEDAILDTGTRQIAFVDQGNGYFEPRYVVLGEKIEDYYTVNMGLKAGEHVVIGANFLIDSESQLKAALGNMTGGHKH
jgi:Cu(I)/Ag(I) efflux system membrane fusion protein